MAVAATLLFGSVARADSVEGSDTDLLLINLDEEMRHLLIGHVSLFLYPWRKLEQDAQHGDLFVCHLVHEAKPLVDPQNYFPKLRRMFRYRSTYRDEISWATDLGWFLVRFGEELNSSLQAKRALWCVRTILIARSAERRDPAFAPQQLAKQTSSIAGRDLLCNRHHQHNDPMLREALRRFLEDETTPDLSMKHADRNAFFKRFVKTSNRVALQTLRKAEDDRVSYVG